MSELKLSQVRLQIAVEVASQPKQTKLHKQLVKGCAEDPHVKKVLKFYGVEV